MIGSILLFGVIGFVVNWIAYAKGFYKLPSTASSSLKPIPLAHVAAVFAIYLGTMLILAPLLMEAVLFFYAPSPPSIELLTFLQFLILAGVMTGLVWFCGSHGKETFKRIIKDPSALESRPIYYDFGIGALTWVLAFPLVSGIGEICDLLIYLTLGVENYEQVAVRYLKNTLESPSQLTLALVTIVLIAPIIEEFLFRGCLQNYLKRFLGTKAAILLTSLAFALFHYSGSQEIGNVSLIASLFTFALFLGFIYEKQSSLFASIGLHMTFNLASALRILLAAEG